MTIASIETQLIHQFDISFIDISSYIGLAAAGVMTANLFIGLLLSMQYNPVTHWPKRRVPLFNLHKWSGYSALFLALLHPAWLPLARDAHFTVWNVFYPFSAPVQPWINSVGALAVYTLIFVVTTAYLRQRFQYAFWKKLHYASYIVLISFLVHGIFTDPSLKPDTQIDYLDGGKLFIEACALLCIGMIGWRVVRGRALRAANAANASLQQEQSQPAWHGELVVMETISVAPDVRIMRLASADGKLPFSFAAGQYLSIRMQDEQGAFIRNYSISSAPGQNEFCDIAVKKIANGRGSTYLHEHSKSGDMLKCTGPNGTFTFTGTQATGVVLIAGGIGITPLLSIVRHLADTQWPHDVYMIFAVRTPADILFDDELKGLQQRYPQFKLLILPSEIDGFQWSGHHGLITTQHVQAFIPGIAHLPVYLCGPESMMNAVTAMLTALAVPKSRIHTELFSASRSTDDDKQFVEATVVFDRSGKKIVVPAGRTLLDAADEAGVVIDSSCRVGTCGTCKITLVSGQVKMHRDDLLSNQEMKKHIVLACQARAITDEIKLNA